MHNIRNLNLKLIILASLFCYLFSLKNTAKENEDAKKMTISVNEERDERIANVIRKSIMNQIDKTNKKEKQIADQVEPLIKKMFHDRHVVPSKTKLSSRANKNFEVLASKNSTIRIKTIPFKSDPKHNIIVNASTNIATKSLQRNTVEEREESSSSGDGGGEYKTIVDPSLVDDEDAVSSGEGSGDGSNNESKEQSSKGANRPRTTSQSFVEEDSTTYSPTVPLSSSSSNNNKVIPLEWSSITITSVPKTTKKPTKLSFYSEKRIELHYYGPCIFCNIRSSLFFGQFERELKRKQFRTVLLNYDYAFLVQKYPSGIYATILSFGVGHTTFPMFHYLEINAPLSCGCFAKAPNTRYILAGSRYAGKMILNAFYPLYEVNSFKDIELIQDAMKKTKPIKF